MPQTPSTSTDLKPAAQAAATAKANNGMVKQRRPIKTTRALIQTVPNTTICNIV